MKRLVRVALLSAVATAAVTACTDTYLYDQRRDDQLPRDRTVSVVGEFCSPSSDEVVRPIKIVIAMDASQSMRVTDPDGTRAQATIDLIDSLPDDSEIYFAVMVFAGSVPQMLTTTGLDEFEPLSRYTPAEKQRLKSRILAYKSMGNDPNRDATDFVKPLAQIYSLINRDIANTRVMARGNETRGRYSVIFLSDGQPTRNQDDELLCGDAVRRIRQLKDLADDVKVNTVNVFVPNQPIASSLCEFDGGITQPVGGSDCLIPNLPVGTCPLLIVNQNADRLSRMAKLGGGDFRDFRNNEPINFLNFRFGQVRRQFLFDKVVVSNFSAPVDSPLDQADTDSDGLTDEEERKLGTSVIFADTDGDGFSDGVEVYFKGRGANFTVNQKPTADGGGLDPGCPIEFRGVDSDCDGLFDCDEQIIGTNPQRMDTDDDGIPDAIEWKGLSQPSAQDLALDPDNDLLTTGEEVSMHTDPLTVDSSNLSNNGYRYEVVKNGGLDAKGRQCYLLKVTNVLLANTVGDTRDAGNPDGGAPFDRRGAGFNDIVISASMRPGDDPTGRTLIKMFRSRVTRFPVGGIRAPVDGIVTVNPDDFTPGCGPNTAVPPVSRQ